MKTLLIALLLSIISFYSYSDTRTLPRFPGARYHLGGFIFRPEMF